MTAVQNQKLLLRIYLFSPKIIHMRNTPFLKKNTSYFKQKAEKKRKKNKKYY